MPKYLLFPILFVSLFQNCSNAQNPEPTGNSGFALVELFTSEGCSSCPPADALVNDLYKQSTENKQAIFILNFHVDYWNYLGWKDPYSREEFTQRQYVYGEHFENGRVYTPEMHVNGGKAFVGSESAEVRSQIKNALEKLSPNRISLNYSDGKLSYSAVNKVSGNEQVYLAFIEFNCSSAITAGENEGKKLFHNSVVREFRKLNSDSSGAIEVPVAYRNKNKYGAVIWTQNFESMTISSAAQVTW